MKLELNELKDITGTHWIEFNISGTPESYEFWSQDSMYLDENAYNLFTDIFEWNTGDYNYYGCTAYSQLQLKKIKIDVKGRIAELEQLPSLESLITFSKTSSYAINLEVDLKEEFAKLNFELPQLIQKIIFLAEEIIALLEKCIEENRTLLILGL